MAHALTKRRLDHEAIKKQTCSHLIEKTIDYKLIVPHTLKNSDQSFPLQRDLSMPTAEFHEELTQMTTGIQDTLQFQISTIAGGNKSSSFFPNPTIPDHPGRNKKCSQ